MLAAALPRSHCHSLLRSLRLLQQSPLPISLYLPRLPLLFTLLILLIEGLSFLDSAKSATPLEVFLAFGLLDAPLAARLFVALLSLELGAARIMVSEVLTDAAIVEGVRVRVALLSHFLAPSAL